MLYSITCEYAIRALTYLANSPDQIIQLRTIADRENIPYAFLGKVFQGLVRAGYLHSVKGLHGGYSLARAAKDITLYDIKITLDGPSGFTRCAWGLGTCPNEVPCPLHEAWVELRGQITHYLQTISLSNLTGGS